VPAPGHDAQEAEGLTPCARCCSSPATTRRSWARADALILDLEDSVGGPRKAAARQIVAQYIAATRALQVRPRLYVRINALDTPLWEGDLAGVVAAGPDGILLPKSRSGEDVHKLSIALHHAEERAGALTGATRIIAIASEVAVSLLRLSTYVEASGRLEGLTWGAEDLAAAVGAHANREADGSWTSPYQLARNLCLFTAVAANAQPIDTVFVNFRDEEGFRKEAGTAARDGFTGKMAIHPSQVAPINEIFTPRPEEVARAREIVEAFADAPDAGVLAIRGHMVDRAHVKGAERILARAKAAGI
jgi:citrate lyase subunit beta/citryl-CoA lyase